MKAAPGEILSGINLSPIYWPLLVEGLTVVL